jgi:hypothetical protein
MMQHADIGDDGAHEGLTFRGVGEIELPAPGLGSLTYDLISSGSAKSTRTSRSSQSI